MFSWPLAYPFHAATDLPGAGIFSPGLAATLRYRDPRRETLPDDFPNYMVYVTRETLLGLSNSLTKASIETHDYFLRTRQVMAADRMMRTFFPWCVPNPTGWPMQSPQSWALPAQRQEPLSAALLWRISSAGSVEARRDTRALHSASRSPTLRPAPR